MSPPAHDLELDLPVLPATEYHYQAEHYHDGATHYSTYEGERYGAGRFATFHGHSLRQRDARQQPLVGMFPVDALSPYEAGGSDEREALRTPSLGRQRGAAVAATTLDQSPPNRRTPTSFQAVPMVRSESVPVLTYAELERVGGTRGWASARGSLAAPRNSDEDNSDMAETARPSPRNMADGTSMSPPARTWPRRETYTAFSDPFASTHTDSTVDEVERTPSPWPSRRTTRTRPPLPSPWSPSATPTVSMSVSTSSTSPLPYTPPSGVAIPVTTVSPFPMHATASTSGAASPTSTGATVSGAAGHALPVELEPDTTGYPPIGQHAGMLEEDDVEVVFEGYATASTVSTIGASCGYGSRSSSGSESGSSDKMDLPPILSSSTLVVPICSASFRRTSLRPRPATTTHSPALLSSATFEALPSSWSTVTVPVFHRASAVACPPWLERHGSAPPPLGVGGGARF